ncbi:AAA family ATPase [Spirosoma sp. HMF4905]|uniref:AAA family ATPase n=1 Tax=Spirosoma arboris TaxID=2682092 RepID=A0A7K1S9G5_9BACT|nr:DnaB-like helicase C-terminal domain-containing protein [Spirosoma arboris]MVM30482.1 AAA family ATPase [Spirosoma arboris]
MNRTYKPKKTNEDTEPLYDTSFTCDVAAERALIAILLDSPQFMPDVLELLGGRDVITDEGYLILFNTLKVLYEEGKVIKLGTVLQKLNLTGESAKLLAMGISLIDLPREAKSIDLVDTCQHLRSLWVKRTALESASSIVSAVRSGSSVSQIIDVLTNASESVSEGVTIGADQSLNDILRDSLSSLESAMNKPGSLTGVNTGLGKLNRNLGGWQDSDIVMIAGRPGMGKSVAGVFHAIAAAREGIPVAFLSLEMPAKSLMNRIIANETGIPYSRIKKGNVGEDELARIHSAIGRIERLPIHFYDDHNADVNDLSYKLLHWKKRYGIGLVIIDYVQKMSDRTIKSSAEYDILTSVSNKLQSLRKRLNCPIIELAQLSRGVETRQGSKRAGMADLRSTGQFEQDATIVIMLYRDDYYKEKAARDAAEANGGGYMEPQFDQLLEYGIVKSRDGETGTAVFWTDVATNRIADQAPISEMTSLALTEPSIRQTTLLGWGEPLKEAGF